MIVIAHLSDPHLDGSEEARSRLRRMTSYLGRFSRPVDVILLTGDLADHGLEAEYAELAGELPSDIPALVLPGNHDVSAGFRAGLASYVDSPGEGHPIHQVRDVAGARFVLVDSTVPGENHGLLSEESLGWLDGVLREPFDGPVFVAMHHPPLDLNHPVMDQWMLRDRDALEAVLRGKPITALLTGHVHNAIVTTFAGHPVLGAPGIRSTVPLPFEPPPPAGTVVDPSSHPGLALHVLVDGKALETVYRYPVHMSDLSLRAIGHVESTLITTADAPRQGDEGGPDAWIAFDESVRAALADLKAGDEIILISWLDRADRDVLAVHPRSDETRPMTGVFSTRSPDRPNPLGLHRVTVLAVDGVRIQVDNLEAIDGTPIVDVKPVLRGIDER